MLSDFYAHGVCQQDLLATSDTVRGNSALMGLMDQINEKMPNSLYFASEGTKQSWAMERELLSPAFTTSWNALPKAR